MSIRVFREYLHARPDGTVDASQVTSRECYEAFLLAKKSVHCENEAKKFRRTLTTHLTGVDGRRAFEPAEEEAILLLLRQNKPWPCFPAEMQVGSMFRGKGFHEKQLLMNQSHPSTSTGVGTSPPMSKRPKLEPSAASATAMGQTPSSGQRQLVSAEQVARTVLNQDDNTFVFSLASEVVKFSSSFASFGIDVWRSVFGIFRFVLLVRTKAVYKDVSDEYVQELCDRVSAEDGHQVCVTILDVLSRDFDKHVRAQNEQSLAFFGRSNDSTGQHVKMEPSNLFDISMAVGSSYAQPGQTFYILNQTLIVKGETKIVKSAYRVDPVSLLMCCKSVPMDSAPQQSVLL
ncbi:hypothetical protein BASA81_004735 [Batrachochytrium salamandrivorans]|nr:hypothetical protein BASA81_004735 [Batrachochytrium salamandrivorans]